MAPPIITRRCQTPGCVLVSGLFQVDREANSDHQSTFKQIMLEQLLDCDSPFSGRNRNKAPVTVILDKGLWIAANPRAKSAQHSPFSFPRRGSRKKCGGVPQVFGNGTTNRTYFRARIIVQIDEIASQ
jgi:hypothetical protein